MSNNYRSTRQSIETDQITELNAMLSKIIPANDFYSAKLNTNHHASVFGSLEKFTKTCPFTLKSDLVDDQANHPPYGTTLTYPVSKYTRYNLTSGTTGELILTNLGR